MSSVDKALLVYCTAVSFFCVVLTICIFRLQNNVVELNKNQQTLENEIENLKDFDLKMWKDQVEINKRNGVEYETY